MDSPTLPRPENEFPTIQDLRDGLSTLVENGFGDLPVQLVVVPDSTMQAISGVPPEMPVLMIDLATVDGRLPVGMVSVGGLQRTSRERH